MKYSLVFITGPHGSGKTYLAEKIKQTHSGIALLDCGPTVRQLHAESNSTRPLHEWIETNRFSDSLFIENLVLESFRKSIASFPDFEVLVIVGPRSMTHIRFLAEGLGYAWNQCAIVYIDCPSGINRENFEGREHTVLSDMEYENLLRKDKRRGLEKVHEYAKETKENCRVIINENNNEKAMLSDLESFLEMHQDLPQN